MRVFQRNVLNLMYHQTHEISLWWEPIKLPPEKEKITNLMCHETRET